TPSEAAFIAGLSQREVQKAFDEGWFAAAPRRDVAGSTRRFLGPAGLVHLRLVKDVARFPVLQTQTQRIIHRQMRERIADRTLDSVQHASPIGSETDLRRYFDQLGDRLKEPVKVQSVSVDAAAAWEQMTERLAEAIEARQAVVSDPDIRGGEPV